MPGLRRVESEPTLLQSRRHLFGTHAAQSIPGYMGHVPGKRIENFEDAHRTHGVACRGSHDHRSVPAFNVRRTELERQLSRTAPLEPQLRRKPERDVRGIGSTAGDYFHSRIPHFLEEKDPPTSGVTALDFQGYAHQVPRYARAAKGIPGYKGHIPGKHAENLYADTWQKTSELSIGAHVAARHAAPKTHCILTEGHTLVNAVPGDCLTEIPMINNSYQDHIRGWSDCEYSGTQIDPAGRLAPNGRQEHFGCRPPPLRGKMHGYAGYVPGRTSENVIGERQCKTNHVAELLTNKNRMRITQR